MPAHSVRDPPRVQQGSPMCALSCLGLMQSRAYCRFRFVCAKGSVGMLLSVYIGHSVGEAMNKNDRSV